MPNTNGVKIPKGEDKCFYCFSSKRVLLYGPKKVQWLDFSSYKTESFIEPVKIWSTWIKI